MVASGPTIPWVTAMPIRPSVSLVCASVLASCLLAVSASGAAGQDNRDARVNKLILDLFSEDKATRLAAVGALGADGGPRGVEALGNVMAKGDDAMRQAAVDGLAAAGAKGMKVLAESLPKVSVACQLKIIAAVAASADPDGLVPLKVALKHNSPKVRAMAVLVLVRLAPADAAGTLKAMRGDVDASVRSAARWGALRLGGGRLARADKHLAAKLKGNSEKLDFKKIPLADVLQFLAETSDVSFFVDRRALRRAGLADGKAVTCKVEGSLALAIDAVLFRSWGPGVDWLADGTVIRVAPHGVLLRLLDTPVAATTLDPDCDPKVTKATVKALAQTFPRLDFREVPFELCMQFMTEVAELKLHVRWDALKIAKVGRNAECSVSLTNVPVGKGLQLLLDSAAGTGLCTYAVCGPVVVISTREDLAALAKRTWPKGLSAAEGLMQADLKAHLARNTPGADSEANPLEWFARRGEAATIRRILGGLDAKQRAAACSDVLPAAVSEGRIKMAGFLLDQGADIETQNRGRASLHIAAEGGQIKLVSLLVSRGANVNAQSARGMPLARAKAALGWQEGELKTARDEKKKQHEANVITFKQIIELLSKHGATEPKPNQ